MNINFEKRNSEIDNFGIFTNSPIPKNTEFYKIPLKIVYSKPKSRCARIADNKYVDDDKVLNWINHSCDPNSKLNINRGDPALISIKDIARDEEITVDYNKTEIEGIRMKCYCGSKNCKGYFNRL